jgi:hypothetical protein
MNWSVEVSALSVCLSVFVPVCLSVCLSVCLCVSLDSPRICGREVQSRARELDQRLNKLPPRSLTVQVANAGAEFITALLVGAFREFLL